ncbi:PREDICTED: LOW QUALITY PROTEIN: sentrin-specific protease 2-like [Buceros rhinoceros silvestris]|uniref:LOW QUALITY PROTEIN: sentrin-specific protease 2-like n=1 Tax=Buceros rhinoceros silvestris TaxID=175836 RepID=UPI000528561D|nr:PREDICTED: LOW QUALITY PROTEIN: sentrin-specific protease 2-like [Buceros rhinoceros silvestris]
MVLAPASQWLSCHSLEQQRRNPPPPLTPTFSPVAAEGAAQRKGKKRHSLLEGKAGVQPPVGGPDETPAKKQKTGDAVSETVPEASAAVWSPARAARKRPTTPSTESAEEGLDGAEEGSCQSPLAPVPSRKSPALDAVEKKFSSLEKPAEPFSPLPEAMEREVRAAFGRGQPEEIMSCAFNLKVTREDIGTLCGLRWLNSEVINFYMKLLVERNKKAGYPTVHAFNTFFYTKLTSGGYTGVRRWTRGVDLFEQDIILVPIHLRMHWALVVIDVRKKTITYYDSLRQKGDKICQTLFRYLQEESREKRNVDLASSEWTLHSMEPHEIPQQLNGSDCGVFMCKYADYISRDEPITFTQRDMPGFRKKMAWEILHQQLL